MHNSIRLFAAAPLPQILKEQLQAYNYLFGQPGVRFIPEENLHLTLFFIGNTSPGRIPETEAALAGIAGSTAPFGLQLAAIEPGPQPGKPRLIWARFAADPAFEALSSRISTALALTPLQPAKPVPHITLARFRKNMNVPQLPVAHPAEPIRLQVSEVALWQSTLGQPHPNYTILRRFTLSGN